MRMESPDFTQVNIDKLAELLPNVITETKGKDGKLKKAVNFDLLRQFLSKDLVDEVYEFTWVGKKESILEAGRSIRKTFRPCKEESKNWDTTENLYIEGDNLEALKLLQKSYLAKIKMIYIDPPYNTGNDFIYKDNFTKSKQDYNVDARVYDVNGDRLFKNTESNGRFHSDWCSMIYTRLLLARNLLRDDGVIFISIDDCEADNLRKICNEIYGAKNFVADICVVNNLKGRNDKKYIARANERLLMYVKSEKFEEHGLNLTEGAIQEYQYEDKYGKYRLIELRKRGGDDTRADRPNMYYPIFVNPDTGSVSLEKDEIFRCEALPIKSNGIDGRWRWGINNTRDNLNMLYGKLVRGKYNIYEKDYLESEEGARRIKPKSVLSGAQYSTDVATKEYRALMNPIDFDNPKPLAMVKDLILYSTRPDENCIILDFFSGSATTSHAVMQLNAEDNGNRKFIMVQLPEMCPLDSAAAKAGCSTICEIGKERIRRAGEKIKSEIEAVNAQQTLVGSVKSVPDIGFRVLKVDDTNMKDVFYPASDIKQGNLLDYVSNIKEDRTELDLLFQCILDWQLPLTLKHTTDEIDGVTVHTYAYPASDQNDRPELMACFNPDMTESVVQQIAKRQPVGVVFRDASFASSPAKINVSEIFKTLSPNTTIKVL